MMPLLDIVFFALASAAYAQNAAEKGKQSDVQQNVPVQELQVGGNPALSDMPAVGVSDVSCDGSGNIYVRSTAPRTATESTLSLPVVKLARSGRVSQFASNSIEGLPSEITIFQYAVGPSGHLYEIVQAVVDEKQALYLVDFSGDGQYVSKSRFADSKWVPQTFLPLPSGDFLIAGSTMERGNPAGSFGGIFGEDARLKRSMKLTGGEPDGGGFVLGRRDAQVGPDGNIYILHRSSSPTVQVISESGDAIRSLTLATPIADSGPMDFYIAQRSLLVSFQAKQSKEVAHPVQYALYDLQDGKLLRSYYLPSRTGFITCYSGDATNSRNKAVQKQRPLRMVPPVSTRFRASVHITAFKNQNKSQKELATTA